MNLTIPKKECFFHVFHILSNFGLYSRSALDCCISYVPTKSVGLFGVFFLSKVLTLAELRLQSYVPWRNWQLTFHFTGFNLNWISLKLILLNSYRDQCLHKELEFPTWLSSHCFCLSTCLLVLHTGKTEFYVAILGILHGAHWTLSLSQSCFFFLLKRTGKLIPCCSLLPSIDSFLVYLCFCSLFSVFR